MAPPETRYVRSGDARIAYQAVGEGATDLVIVPGLVSHLGLTWQIPEHAQFCRELARFSRVILFDKRGTGLSDRDKGAPGLELPKLDVAATADARLVIPIKPGLRSLNVAMAAAMALGEALRQTRPAMEATTR